MRSTLLSSVVLVGIGGAMGISGFGCTETECGPGTINRAGKCEPADETVGVAKCGPFTELRGNQCVPMFPATTCDPATTQADMDPTTGVTTCIGTGGGGCSAPLACPAPAAGKQSMCGQLYNFEDNTPLAVAGATGAKCASPAPSGPCALTISAKFPLGPMDLPTREVYVDDCGRYRVSDVEVGSSTSVVLYIDDSAAIGVAGITVPTHVGVPGAAGSVTKDLDAWVVKKSTVDKWTADAAEVSLTSGVYAAIFRTHVCDSASGRCKGDRLQNQSGVKLGLTPPPDLNGGAIGNVFHFADGEQTHLNIDPAATNKVTSVNGTALTTAKFAGITYLTGTGALTGPGTCKWARGRTIPFPGSVFFQVYRPVDDGSTCNQ
jgi:hypothetical protein